QQDALRESAPPSAQSNRDKVKDCKGNTRTRDVIEKGNDSDERQAAERQGQAAPASNENLVAQFGSVVAQNMPGIAAQGCKEGRGEIFFSHGDSSWKEVSQSLVRVC